MPRRKAAAPPAKAPKTPRKPPATPAANTDVADRFDAVRNALLDIQETYEAEFALMAAYDDRCTLGIGLQRLIDAFSDKTIRARIKKQQQPKQQTLGERAS